MYHSSSVLEKRKTTYAEAYKTCDTSGISSIISSGMTIEDAREEVLAALACRFKLHIQIKPEFLMSFVKDFMRFVLEDKNCKNIYAFKVATKFIPGRNYFPKKGKKRKKLIHPPAIIVVYITLLPGTKEAKNCLLNKIVTACLERYKAYDKYGKKGMALKIFPRFSRGLFSKELSSKAFFISGGDGDDKIVCFRISKEYKKNAKKDKSFLSEYDPINIYTEDLAFFKGLEFECKKAKEVSEEEESEEEESRAEKSVPEYFDVPDDCVVM
jgi:hypothetical protein